MTAEFPVRKESRNSYFTAYSGTTFGNYLKGAYMLDNGLVGFDKRRNPLHEHPDIFFLENPAGALEYAAGLALEMLDIPVVMAGSISAQYRGKEVLPVGSIFPVTNLWMPRKGISRIERAELLLQATEFGETQEAFASLVSVDPESVLREHA